MVFNIFPIKWFYSFIILSLQKAYIHDITASERRSSYGINL